MLGRIEDVNGELQKQGALQESGQRRVELRGKRDQDAGAFGVAHVRVPVIAALVALLGAGPFLQGEA